jgi:hypothetical protein
MQMYALKVRLLLARIFLMHVYGGIPSLVLLPPAGRPRGARGSRYWSELPMLLHLIAHRQWQVTPVLVLMRVWPLGHETTSPVSFLPMTRSTDDTLEQPLSTGASHHRLPLAYEKGRSCLHARRALSDCGNAYRWLAQPVNDFEHDRCTSALESRVCREMCSYR